MRHRCRAPNRSAPCPTGTPVRSVAPATHWSDSGLPQTTAVCSTGYLLASPRAQRSPAHQICKLSEDCLGDHPQCFRVGVPAEQHGIDMSLFPRVLPSLQPVTNAISRTDQCNLINQSIGDSSCRLRLAAAEEGILDPNCRGLVPQALCMLIVEIFVAGAHAADVE